MSSRAPGLTPWPTEVHGSAPELAGNQDSSCGEMVTAATVARRGRVARSMEGSMVGSGVATGGRVGPPAPYTHLAARPAKTFLLLECF